MTYSPLFSLLITSVNLSVLFLILIKGLQILCIYKIFLSLLSLSFVFVMLILIVFIYYFYLLLFLIILNIYDNLGLNYKFLYAKSGDHQNPQNKIVAALAEVTVGDLSLRYDYSNIV